MTRKTSLLLVVALAACGRGDSGRGEDQGAAAKPAPAKAAPAKATPAALTPYSHDPAKVLAADELHRAYFAWKWDKKAVSVVGYCKFFFDTGTAADCGDLTAEPNGEKVVANAKHKPGGPADTFDRATPAVFRCTIEESPYDELQLVDCELTGKGKPAAVDDKPAPTTIDLARPIPIGALAAAENGWAGKEVSVEGRYWGHTTSKSLAGEVLSIRVDLQAASGGDQLVACNVAAEPPQSVSDRRDGVIVRGTIAPETFFEQVLLEPCTITNR